MSERDNDAMYQEMRDAAYSTATWPKRLGAPLGLNEWECSDGTTFYDSRFAKSYQIGLDRKAASEHLCPRLCECGASALAHTEAECYAVVHSADCNEFAEGHALHADMKQHVLSQQPRGLARLDAQGLAELRAIILTVIDAGDPTLAHVGDIHVWELYESDEISEAYANDQRLDFCDAIQAAIVARAAPATATPTTSTRDPDHLRSDKGGNRAGDDYW